MTTAPAVAQHLIRLAADGPEPEPMTSMKLHKLLYYCQGWHLAWYGVPLFPERIVAWKHGPVVPDVYAQPWGQGSAELSDPMLPLELSPPDRAAVEQVWGYYRQFSACGLREKSHAESPWRDHFKPDSGGRGNQTIPVEVLKVFFGGELEKRTGDRPGSWGEIDGELVPLDSLKRVLSW